MIGGYESAYWRQPAPPRIRLSGPIGQSTRFKSALVFSGMAAGRKMLGSESQGEIDIVRDSLGGVGVRLGGFYGYGEQAPVRNKGTHFTMSPLS